MTTAEETKTEEPRTEETRQRTWTEELEVAADELVATVKNLIQEGNVRRVVILQPSGEVLLNIPLTIGAVVGGFVALSMPMLTVLIFLAGALAKFKLQVVRVSDGNQA